MGFADAVGRCYARIVTFSGRARRAEYWWFFLYQIVVSICLQVALILQVMDDPAFLQALRSPEGLEPWLSANPQVASWGLIALAFWLLLMALPNLSVTVRRLHDTNRRGWMILMPTLVGIVSGVAGGVLAGAAAASGSAGTALLSLAVMTVPSILASLWLLVVLCLPGTDGPNRFGPDPIPDREPAHPAFARVQDGASLSRSEKDRKAVAREYYRTRVLTSIHRPEGG